MRQRKIEHNVEGDKNRGRKQRWTRLGAGLFESPQGNFAGGAHGSDRSNVLLLLPALLSRRYHGNADRRKFSLFSHIWMSKSPPSGDLASRCIRFGCATSSPALSALARIK